MTSLSQCLPLLVHYCRLGTTSYRCTCYFNGSLAPLLQRGDRAGCVSGQRASPGEGSSHICIEKGRGGRGCRDRFLPNSFLPDTCIGEEHCAMPKPWDSFNNVDYVHLSCCALHFWGTENNDRRETKAFWPAGFGLAVWIGFSLFTAIGLGNLGQAQGGEDMY